MGGKNSIWEVKNGSLRVRGWSKSAHRPVASFSAINPVPKKAHLVPPSVHGDGVLWGRDKQFGVYQKWIVRSRGMGHTLSGWPTCVRRNPSPAIDALRGRGSGRLGSRGPCWTTCTDAFLDDPPPGGREYCSLTVSQPSVAFVTR